MAHGGYCVSDNTFDALVSNQRTYNEKDWTVKIQEKYWQAKQKFLSKVEEKEDSFIALSDSKLDSKLEIYRSIDRSCARSTNILERYQNFLFQFANEENALGILLKECGKHDKTNVGKIMSLTGRSLTRSSHQRMCLYMPLLRLYQEMETFHTRAVEDTANTVDKLESKRSKYRASLLWMKDISEKLDPDVYKQLDKFRRVQKKVRQDKKAFDGMQMDVVQKIDLLMASRCNLINQILAPYQAILLETFEKNCNNFKSVEELIRNEDFYAYEFQMLKQLNPLKIDEDDENSPVHPKLEAPNPFLPSQLIGLDSNDDEVPGESSACKKDGDREDFTDPDALSSSQADTNNNSQGANETKDNNNSEEKNSDLIDLMDLMDIEPSEDANNNA